MRFVEYADNLLMRDVLDERDLLLQLRVVTVCLLEIFNGLVEGRISKHVKEISLMDQTYVKAEDGKQSVAKYLESVSKDLKVAKFVRFEVGEGMEKKNEDFAAEVAAQMGN